MSCKVIVLFLALWLVILKIFLKLVSFCNRNGFAYFFKFDFLHFLRKCCRLDLIIFISSYFHAIHFQTWEFWLCDLLFIRFWMIIQRRLKIYFFLEYRFDRFLFIGIDFVLLLNSLGKFNFLDLYCKRSWFVFLGLEFFVFLRLSVSHEIR